MTTPIDPEAQEQARLAALAFEMHMRPEDYAEYERDMAEQEVQWDYAVQAYSDFQARRAAMTPEQRAEADKEPAGGWPF